MRLKTLDIRGFGQLRGIVDLETGPGSIALLLESNEAGKSTLAAAITAGLYGLDSNRTRHRNRMTPVERFRPWGGGSYGLELLLDRGGHELRITRDFDRGQVEVLDGARDITSEFQRGKSVEVGEILTGLTEAQFALSAFVPQGAIVWDDPSALAEALQRAADSQAGDNTAASAIDVLQSALDQYEGIELKKGRARTEVQRCREEAANAEAALDDLERRRGALDEEIDQLRSLETAEDQSRIRRGALRLRRSMTVLEFESAALASDSERIARSRELEARLDEDPALELITDEVRRAVESARRDHGILLVKYQKAAVDLSNAGELRDQGREQLQKEALAGTPTRAQVSELGAWCHAHADIARRRSQLQGSLDHERAQLRRAGFDPATATRLGERFSGLIEADHAILGSLRKRRMEIEDESERLSARLAEARAELESIARDQDRRRRKIDSFAYDAAHQASGRRTIAQLHPEFGHLAAPALIPLAGREDAWPYRSHLRPVTFHFDQRQDATAEKTPGKNTAASDRRDRSSHNIVIGNRDDSAHKSVERPQDHESCCNPQAAQLSGNGQQCGDRGKTGRPAKRTHDIIWHASRGTLCQESHDKLCQQPAEPQNSACRPDSVDAAGEMKNQARDDGGGIDRR